MKLQILIPQYKETEDIIKPLLDSIEIQQNIDLTNEVGVIIVNDGTDVHLSREFLDRYTFHIDYYLNEHKGVSATRNACLDYATADYVMFCDADDMFYNACGLYIIFREINGNGFDSLVSKFIEEVRDRTTHQPIYITHDIDSTFVHGKVYRRKYLVDNNIRWNEALTLHEDGYFNTLCQRLTTSVKYCSTPFYLWRWRDDSVCRSDSQWVLKTYDHMINANEALIDELLRRGRKPDAQFYVTTLLLDAYFTMQGNEWAELKNKEHCAMVKKRLGDYYLKFKYLYETMAEDVKTQIITKMKNGRQIEGYITFEDWIKQVEDT
jgi:glycosyltransferase involved in cell wall biosynthesis